MALFLERTVAALENRMRLKPENSKFSFNPCRQEVTDCSLRPLEPWKFFQKLANRLLVTRIKNQMHINATFFSKQKPATGCATPQMPLTV